MPFYRVLFNWASLYNIFLKISILFLFLACYAFTTLSAIFMSVIKLNTFILSLVMLATITQSALLPKTQQFRKKTYFFYFRPLACSMLPFWVPLNRMLLNWAPLEWLFWPPLYKVLCYQNTTILKKETQKSFIFSAFFQLFYLSGFVYLENVQTCLYLCLAMDRTFYTSVSKNIKTSVLAQSFTPCRN